MDLQDEVHSSLQLSKPLISALPISLGRKNNNGQRSSQAHLGKTYAKSPNLPTPLTRL